MDRKKIDAKVSLRQKEAAVKAWMTMRARKIIELADKVLKTEGYAPGQYKAALKIKNLSVKLLIAK